MKSKRGIFHLDSNININNKFNQSNSFNNYNPKRAQVTIFVILGLLIISIILIYLFWLKPTYIDTSGTELNFESCVKKAVQDKIEILGEQGGFEEPNFFYEYKGNKVGYLCYTNLYYESCIVQKPFLKQHFEEQLKKSVENDVYNCYDSSIDELKKLGYSVTQGDKDLKISLIPGKVNVLLEAPLVLDKESSSKISEFNIKIDSDIYSILMVATSIIEYETTYGDSEITTYMSSYPNLIIDKFKQGDGTTIYIIQDKELKTKFHFASRSYAWPAGYGSDSGLLR
ncbi:MAG: hypothetical protein ACOYT4_01045 [Nanoarchaeota archaeon]